MSESVPPVRLLVESTCKCCGAIVKSVQRVWFCSEACEVRYRRARKAMERDLLKKWGKVKKG